MKESLSRWLSLADHAQLLHNLFDNHLDILSFIPKGYIVRIPSFEVLNDPRCFALALKGVAVPSSPSASPSMQAPPDTKRMMQSSQIKSAQRCGIHEWRNGNWSGRFEPISDKLSLLNTVSPAS
ncbi:hypothetical protein NL676_013213 [Syzygium grande]|nr:hypothetical protein NL676_013213 [Syzygium grande]